jgi:hypothetical protein
VTVFDLLFIVLLFAGIGAIGVAVFSAFRGQRARALAIVGKLGVCAASYVGMVYLVTFLSKPAVLRIGEPQCSDDWCIAVDGVKRTPMYSTAIYDVTLRIFSRARRVAQRELIAKDVYLVDARWRRYNPVLTGLEIPLNALLQPGESVTTSRRFEVPAADHDMGLMIDRSAPPFCPIIGECGAFHKGAIVRLD